MSWSQAPSGQKNVGTPPAPLRNGDSSDQNGRPAADRPAWGRGPVVQENSYAARLRQASNPATNHSSAQSSMGQAPGASSNANDNSKSTGSLLSLGSIPQKSITTSNQRTGPTAVNSAGGNTHAARPGAAQTLAGAASVPSTVVSSDGPAATSASAEAAAHAGPSEAPATSSSQTEHAGGVAWQQKSRSTVHDQAAAVHALPSTEQTQAASPTEAPSSHSSLNANHSRNVQEKSNASIHRVTLMEGAASSSAPHAPIRTPTQHNSNLRVATTPAAHARQRPAHNSGPTHPASSNVQAAVMEEVVPAAPSTTDNPTSSANAQPANVADRANDTSSNQASASGAANPGTARRTTAAPAWGAGGRSFANVLAGNTAVAAARPPQVAVVAAVNTAAAAHHTEDAPTSSRAQGNGWQRQRQASTSAPPAQPSTPQPAPRPLHHPSRGHGASSAGTSGSAGPSAGASRAIPALFASSTPVTPPATPPRDPGRPGAWPGDDSRSPAHGDPSASSTSSSSASPSHSSAWRTPLTPGTPTAAAPAPSTSQPRQQRQPLPHGSQQPRAVPAAAARPAWGEPAGAAPGPHRPERPPAAQPAIPAAVARPGSPMQPASPQRREPPPIQPAAVASSSHAAVPAINPSVPSSSNPVRPPPQQNPPSPQPGTPAALDPIVAPPPALESPVHSPTVCTPSPPASPTHVPASNQPSSSAHPAADTPTATAAPRPQSWADRLRVSSNQPFAQHSQAQAWQGVPRPHSSSSVASDSQSVGSHDRNAWGPHDHRAGGRGPGRGPMRGAASTSGGHGRGSGRYGQDASSSSRSGRGPAFRGRGHDRGFQQHQRGRSVDSVSSEASHTSAASSSASRGGPAHGHGPARPPSQPSHLARQSTHVPEHEPSSSTQAGGAHGRSLATQPASAASAPAQPPATAEPARPTAASTHAAAPSTAPAPPVQAANQPLAAHPAAQPTAVPSSAPPAQLLTAQQPPVASQQPPAAAQHTGPSQQTASSSHQHGPAPHLPPIATSSTRMQAAMSSTPNTPTRSPPPNHPPSSPLAPQSPRPMAASLPSTAVRAAVAAAEEPSSSSQGPANHHHTGPATGARSSTQAAAVSTEPLAPASPSARDVPAITQDLIADQADESQPGDNSANDYSEPTSSEREGAQQSLQQDATTTAAELHAGSSSSAEQQVAQASGGVVLDPEAMEKLQEVVRQLCLARTVDQVFPDAKRFRLEPRGLINTGNSCFMNATLQALLATSAFCGVLHALLQVKSQLDKVQFPTLAAMAELAAELQPSPAPAPAPGPDGHKAGDGRVKENEWKEVPRGKKGKAPAHVPAAAPPRPTPIPLAQALGGKPLVPNMMAALVPKFHPQADTGAGAATANGGPVTMAQKLHMSKTAPVDQEQQDAQEFLQFLLDHAHEELLQLKRQVGGQGGSATESEVDVPHENGTADVDEWETVGRRNKSAVTRKHELPFSLISGVFRGRLRSTVKAAGEKASATEEPFMLLHLFIAEGVRTLEEALVHFTAAETIHGYKTKAGNQVEAVKVVKIAEAPRVLVLHLLRFTWQQGNVKNMRHLVFGNHLRLTPSMLAEECPQHRTGVEYKLVATVTHRGRDTWHGHYTAHALQYNGNWLHFNDATVTNATERHVLGESTYMLVYERV